LEDGTYSSNIFAIVPAALMLIASDLYLKYTAYDGVFSILTSLFKKSIVASNDQRNNNKSHQTTTSPYGTTSVMSPALKLSMVHVEEIAANWMRWMDINQKSAWVGGDEHHVCST
jgi:hypothetical protein